MGGQCSGQHMEGKYSYKNLTVVTLSYCGLTSSPFEFYINEYENQLERIGQYFQEMIEIQLPDFCDKKKSRAVFGNLELAFKKRYSPMFDKMAGIIEYKEDITHYKKYRFVTEKQFQQKWQQKYKKYYQEDKKFIKKMKEQKNLENCKQNVRKYDFLMFRALLRYVYKKTDFQDVVNQNPNKYINIISPLFEFSFLDQANKLSKFEYGFRKTNPDVYFLQQTTQELLKFLQKRAKRNYRWIGDEDGQLILIKNQSFQGEDFEIVDLDAVFESKHPTFQQDRVTKPIALGTKSYRFLFISLHFSSRENLNKYQIQYLKNDLLEKIKQKKLYECVILGGNLNDFQDSFPKQYNFYPKLPTQITTFKKRTKTQAQIAKNDVRDKRSLDKIITNQTITIGQITLIDGTTPDEYSDDEAKKQKNKDEAKKQKNKDAEKDQERDKCGQGLNSKIKMLLPCEIHPFDKFLVKTIIQAKYKTDQNSVKQN